MKADIIKAGNRVGEISFTEGNIHIACEDEELRGKIYIHLTCPEASEEKQLKKLEAMQGTEVGTEEYFRAFLEFINEMEKDFEVKVV